MGKKANRMLAILMTAVLTVGNVPVYAADDEEDGRIIQETSETEDVSEDISWPVPGDSWYEAYDYTLKEEDGVIELNNYKKENTAEYVVVPGTATIGTKTYSVELNTVNPDSSTTSLWGTYNQTLKGIKILEGVKAKKCSYLFYYLPELTDLDLSGLDTSGATDMTNFLCYSRKLVNLTLGNLDTSAVTSMEGMFEGISVTSLDLRGFDTTHVTTMSQMFYQCTELTDLDLSSFVTPALTEMSWMFYECSKLENIRWGDGLDTSKVQSMYDVFCNCEKLKDAGIRRFNTSSVTTMADMFRRCDAMTEIDVRNFDFSKVKSMSGMFSGCDNLRTVYFPDDMSTPVLEDMGGMFSSCKKLVKADLSRFDTGNVTDMADMFDYDEQLREVLFSDRFVTSGVTSMRGMFRQCFRLQVLDVSGFDTSSVTDMDSMFESCDALRTINVSGFDTSNVTDMADMFYNCEALLELDVSHFDTSKVTNMYHMFRGCARLRSLDLGSFNTAKVTDFYQLFFECHDLTVADLRSFDFSNGTPIEKSGSGDLHSFIGDSGIRQLYLPVKAMSGFDFSRDLSISGEAGYALTDIFYAGTESEWTALGNVVPADVVMHYEFDGEAAPIVKERIPVSGISLAAHELTLKPGGYKYVQITVSPENATDRGTVSISSDPAVAYSDNYATIWALKPGTCTITVYALDGSSVTDSIAVTVTEADKKLVSSIRLNKSELKLKAGESEKLTATIAPEDAEDKSVEWSSDNTSVATVDAGGKVTAVADGTAKIKVAAKDGSGVSASCTVTVGKGGGGDTPVDPVPIPGSGEARDSQPVIKEGKTLYLVKGQTFTLAKGWSCKDKILSVSKTGVVRAKKTGTTTLVCGDNEKTIDVLITEPTVTSKISSLHVGVSQEIALNCDEHLPVFWYSAAPNIATVEQNGTVTGHSKGTAKVTAMINGKAYTCSVKVVEDKSLPERDLYLNVKNTKTVKIRGLKKTVWTISGNEAEGKEIVKISGSKIKGLKTGDVQLICGDGEYVLNVHVEDPVLSGSAKPYKMSINMEAGDVSKEPVTLPGVEQPVIFKSNKPSVAYIDDSGLIHARSKGTAKITAKVNGKTVTVTVKVK